MPRSWSHTYPSIATVTALRKEKKGQRMNVSYGSLPSLSVQQLLFIVRHIFFLRYYNDNHSTITTHHHLAFTATILTLRIQPISPQSQSNQNQRQLLKSPFLARTLIRGQPFFPTLLKQLLLSLLGIESAQTRPQAYPPLPPIRCLVSLVLPPTRMPSIMNNTLATIIP